MGSRRGINRKRRINQGVKPTIIHEQNLITVCVIQVKHVACISNSVNVVKREIKVFFTVTFCSVVEFNRSGIDHSEKDGRCTFYQNALRSDIISKSKSKSVEGQA